MHLSVQNEIFLLIFSGVLWLVKDAFYHVMEFVDDFLAGYRILDELLSVYRKKSATISCQKRQESRPRVWELIQECKKHTYFMVGKLATSTQPILLMIVVAFLLFVVQILESGSFKLSVLS